MNRRTFIKTGLIFVPTAIKAQGIINPYRFAAATSDTVAFTGFAVTTLRNDYTGEVGYILRASTAITITRVARWVVSGNSGSHTLRIRSMGGTQLASGTVNTSGAPVDAWLWVALSSPLSLSGSTSYFIGSSETSGGDQWYEVITSLTYSAGWAAIESGSTMGYYPSVTAGLADQAFGPVNFAFTNP